MITQQRLEAERAAREFRRRGARKLLRAVLGSSAGDIDVPERAGYVWVRLMRDTGTQLVAARQMSAIQRVAGLPIIIEETPRGYRVVGIDTEHRDNPYVNTIGSHASQHILGPNGSGGIDPLPIYNAALIELRVRAQVPPDMTVHVEAGPHCSGGVWQYFGGGDSPAITPPSGSGEVRIDVICLNADNEIQVIQGTAVVSPIEPEYPTISNGLTPLGAVRIASDATAITDDMIAVPRVTAVPVWGASGGFDIHSLGEISVADSNDELPIYVVGIGETRKIKYGNIIPSAVVGGSPSIYVDGALAAATDVGAYVVTTNSRIDKVYLYCRDKGVSGATIIDVNKNGATIFTQQNNRPTLPFDSNSNVVFGVPNVVDVSEGDILTWDIDSAAVGAASLASSVKLSSVNQTEEDDMIKISSIVVGSSGAPEIDFTNIPNTYSTLILHLVGCSDSNSNESEVELRFNGDGGPNYDAVMRYSRSYNQQDVYEVTGNPYIPSGILPAQNANQGYAGQITITIANYTSGFYKQVQVDNVYVRGLTGGGILLCTVGGWWRSTNPITSIKLTPSGNFVAGTVATLYGLK